MQNGKGEVNCRLVGMGGGPAIRARHANVEGAVAAKDISRFLDQFHGVALLLRVEPSPDLVRLRIMVLPNSINE